MIFWQKGADNEGEWRKRREKWSDRRRHKVSDGRTAETSLKDGLATHRDKKTRGYKWGYVDRVLESKERNRVRRVTKIRNRRNGVPSRKLNECTYNVRLVCLRHSKAKTQTVGRERGDGGGEGARKRFRFSKVPREQA